MGFLVVGGCAIWKMKVRKQASMVLIVTMPNSKMASE